jgi:hypothetical protein
MPRPPAYIARQIDGAALELLPDGTLQIWPAGWELPLILAPELVYALYLFIGMPTVAPTLRRLDADRQRERYEARIFTASS